MKSRVPVPWLCGLGYGIALLANLVSAAIAQTTLYATEFETPTFVASNFGLNGRDGWVVAANGLTQTAAAQQPVYGIDASLVPGLGQTAFIGFNLPTTLTPSLFSAYRPSPYSPPLTGNSGNPIVRFSATIGLTKSTTTYFLQPLNDTFRISFYNNGFNNDGNNRRVLASIEFLTNTSSATSNGTVFRGDSTNLLTNTNVPLIFDEALDLLVVINYQTNRWTASWGGSPLFVDEVFRNPVNASTHPLTVGMVAVQWAITVAGHPGNNWMLFDDWNLSAEPLSQMKVTQASTLNNHAQLIWGSELGYSYRVETSTDLRTWLKGDLITPIQASNNQTYTDPATLLDRKYYRIRRGLPGTVGL